MKTLPDFDRIGAIVVSWQQGVLTPDEAEERIKNVLASESRIPASELCSTRSFAHEAYQNKKVLTSLARIEAKLTATLQEAHIPLPKDLDPYPLTNEEIELARERRMIEAIKIHRERTGTGLAESKRIIEEHLRDESSSRDNNATI